MAKKFGKFIMFSALAATVAAGTYYYLQKKQDNAYDDTDDIDDFDIFDDELDDEPVHSKNRVYVSLDLENAKEFIGEKVLEAIDTTKEKVESFHVLDKLDKAREFVEGFAKGDKTHAPDVEDFFDDAQDAIVEMKEEIKEDK